MLTATRNPDGTFARGVSGNPLGRPKRATETEYLRVMHRLCDPTTWAKITERAIEDALDGDSTARAWLSKYLLPVKPEDSEL